MGWWTADELVPHHRTPLKDMATTFHDKWRVAEKIFALRAKGITCCCEPPLTITI